MTTNYYHRSKGECVVLEKKEPVKTFTDVHTFSVNEHDWFEWQKYIASLPVTAYCDPTEPIGWLGEVREEWQWNHWDGGWQPCSKETYEMNLPNKARIFLVRKPQQEKETYQPMTTDQSNNEELLIEFDKQGCNWNDSIMPKDIFERTYDIGHFLLNHNHPIIDPIKPVVFGKYKVRMKFSYGHWPLMGSIWCNGRWLVCRKRKGGPVTLNKGVNLIEGTPTRSGGSNKYPIPTFKEEYCIIEFTSHGLPMTNSLSGWKTELLSLEKI